MYNYTLFAEQIKTLVSMQDAIKAYIPTNPEGSRVPCPIHGGINPNMSFTDKFFHCFKCGAGGDVIHFVQHVFGIPFRAALDKLNTDFSLGLPLDRRPTLREQRDAQKRYNERMEELARKKAEEQAIKDRRNELWDEWRRLDRNKREYAPQGPDDEFHPLFVEAVTMIDYRAYLVDVFEAEQTM